MADTQRVTVDARWPAAMSFARACAYLDLGETLGRKVLNQIPAFQHDTGESGRRGERYWRRVDLDDYLEGRMKQIVSSPRE